MLKYLKIILILFCCNQAIAQSHDTDGNVKDIAVHLGANKYDSIFRLPTVRPKGTWDHDSLGRLYVDKNKDTGLYYNDGTGEKKVFTIKDTVYLKSLFTASTDNQTISLSNADSLAIVRGNTIWLPYVRKSDSTSLWVTFTQLKDSLNNHSSGSSTYASLTDVNLTSLANGQLAKYNSSSGKWENFTPTYISSYTETDPVANAKIIQIANRYGMLGGGAAQTLGSNPAWTLGPDTTVVVPFTDTLKTKGILTVTKADGLYYSITNPSSFISANQTISFAPTGDVTGTTTGTTSLTPVLTIGANKVTNNMLLGSIAYSKLILTGSLVIADFSATGTPGSDTYLRGDNTWGTPAGTTYTFSTGLTNTLGTVTVNTSQNIAKLSNLTTNGYVKTGSGDGTLSISTTVPYSDITSVPAFITLTGLSGTAPVSYDNTTGAFSMHVADATHDGYLNSTDFNTFSAKLSAAITSLNGLSGATQTFATPGTTGTAPNWSSSGTVHTLHIPMASASSVTAGLLSKTDYDVFNGKQDALSGTGFVKISGSTISYDNNTYLTAVPTTTVNGTTISFGSSNTITASAFTLTTTTLNPLVTTSSLTAVGILGTGTWQATAIADAYISSSTNWNTAYTNRITSLTVTGSSGAATLISNVLNIPTYTLAGLGGTTNHAALSNVSWTASGHTGTLSTLAGWDASNVAAVYTLSGTGTAIPTTTSPTLVTPVLGVASGTSLALSSFLNEAKGVDIASATTTDIGAATGNYVIVTGTVTITGLGTVQAGTRRIVKFTGALTLTHNATSLILPGGANITTVNGDVAVFVSLGSGNWQCVNYQKVTWTGAGSSVFATSPVLVTPNIGVATATSVNGNFFTTGTYTLTGASGKTLTFNNSITFAGTDATTMTFPAASTTVGGLGTNQTWTKGNAGAIVTLTDAATIAIDLSLGNNYEVVLGGNRNLGIPTNITKGQVFVVSYYQDITGSRTGFSSPGWCYTFYGGTAPTLTTTKGALDKIVYTVDNYATSTVTMTSATPCVVTWTSHGLKDGQKLQFTTTGSLYTGLTVSTTYWVTLIDANTFKVSSSQANFVAGTFINTSGSQSGTHTGTAINISGTVGCLDCK